jgi:exosortase/archaeosortase family protein
MFLAMAAAVGLLVRRTWFDKVFLLLGAVPIALVCTIARITATGALYARVGHNLANLIPAIVRLRWPVDLKLGELDLYDLTAYLMMPLALGLLWIELKVISWVIRYQRQWTSYPVATPAPPPIGRPAVPQSVPQGQPY